MPRIPDIQYRYEISTYRYCPGRQFLLRWDKKIRFLRKLRGVPRFAGGVLHETTPANFAKPATLAKSRESLTLEICQASRNYTVYKRLAADYA